MTCPTHDKAQTFPNKHVTTIMPASASKEVIVSGDMFVKDALDQNQSQDVPDVSPTCYNNSIHKTPILSLHTPLRRAAWARVLAHHPDRSYSQTMLSYIDNGVPVFYNGPNFEAVNPNWKSTEVFRDRVKVSIAKDLSLGRKSGPYPEPPLANFRGSPMGAFLKRRSTKLRVIHDLSWPPKWSVNSFIPKDLCSVSYASVHDAVTLIKKSGKNSLCSKIDLEDAYKNILVRKEDWHLLGSSWLNDDGYIEYYLDHVLPFGLRSSAKLFNLFADGLEFAMYLHGCTYSVHYLDDYFTCGKNDTEECQKNLEIMIATCDILGLPVNPKKISLPSTCIEFLGIIIDTDLMELRISEERFDDVIDELKLWCNKKKGSKRDLLSLLGKLVFLSQIVVPGRIFLRRMYDLSCKVKCLHFMVKLSNPAKNDIIWWLEIARYWNHKSMFMDEEWSNSDNLELHTDASGIRIGAIFKSQWLTEGLNMVEQSRSIAWKELFAVVMACASWGMHLKGKKVLIHCDNESVVFSVNNGTSKCKEMMYLIRQLYHLCVSFNFQCRLCHIPGLKNVLADALSRNKINQFKELCPSAESHPVDSKVSRTTILNAGKI